MRKETLSNIKEHTAPTCSLPVKYIMTASLEKGEGKNILFVSFFDQSDKKKNHKEKADYKLFVYDNTHITQKLESDGTYKWSKASIDRLIWSWYGSGLTAGCNTRTEQELITDFFKVEFIKCGDEYKAITNFQNKLIKDKLAVKHNNIKKKIDAVMDLVPPLPKGFDKWVYNGPFGFSRYNYYKREGKNINVFCTECKNDFVITETVLTKKRIKHDQKGVCPKCNNKVIYKATGRTTKLYDRVDFAIIQKFGDGLIVRYFTGWKSYEEHYRQPRFSYREYIREIYSYCNGKLETKRYEYALFCQTGEQRWCDNKNKITTSKAYLYANNLKDVLKGTKWQYSCMYQLAKAVKTFDIDSLLIDYLRYPAIEYLIKYKLYNYVKGELGGWYNQRWYNLNFKSKNIKEVFGFENMETFQQFQRLDLGYKGITLLKTIESKGKRLTDQQVNWVMENAEIEKFVKIMNYTTAHKIIKYAKKQGYKASDVISDWSDYINDARALKYDLTNTFVLFPKDLKDKHEETMILNRAKGLEAYNSKIIIAYENLKDIYTYSDKNFSIRPASSVEDIVTEGHKLRHCVAGHGYVGDMAKGTKAIMLVRKADAPDSPFYTMEVNLQTLSVLQCRGYKNCDMTPEVKAFVEKWKKQKLERKEKIKKSA